jgi:hypothetical protein
MSDARSATPRGARPRSRAARRRPSITNLTIKIGVLAAAATVAIGGALAVQMAGGNDPALGPKAAQTAGAQDSDSSSMLPAVSGLGDDSASSSQVSQTPQALSEPAPVTTRAS